MIYMYVLYAFACAIKLWFISEYVASSWEYIEKIWNCMELSIFLSYFIDIEAIRSGCRFLRPDAGTGRSKFRQCFAGTATSSMPSCS